MVQGHLGDVTAAHLAIAAKTGLLAVLPPLWLTFTRHARLLAGKWTAASILGVCTFAADAAIHSSHYPGEYTEAALTGLGAFLFSLVVAQTPLGHRIDHLAEALFGALSEPGRSADGPLEKARGSADLRVAAELGIGNQSDGVFRDISGDAH
jgi:hypothetical protein